MIDYKNQCYERINNYEKLSDYIRNTSPEDMVIHASACLGINSDDMLKYPMGGYGKGGTSGAYWFVVQDLKENIDHYDWLYHRLKDEESKQVLTNLLSFRLIPDVEFIRKAFDRKNPQYFIDGVVEASEDEVFVDCGGYIGDTTESYIETYGGKYKKIILYEPDSENIQKCEENLKPYHDILIRNAGVGEKNSNISFSKDDSAGSFLVGSMDEKTVEVVSLDEDIEESVSFIKMDIEGFEIPAIIGEKNHIIQDRPKLAICLYHIVSDLWEIPRIIDSMCPEYDFFIRHHQEDWNWETVLYALPPKEKRKIIQIKTAVAITPFAYPWQNVDLKKDCGLIPYLFNKLYDVDVTMVGVTGNPDDYPYRQYVEGLKYESLREVSTEAKIEYLVENSANIDLLILYGGHYDNAFMSCIYKQCNPDGLIYCGLDANSRWMDRLPWYEDTYSEFIDVTDVMATSCTAMADFLSMKWKKKIHCITNGWYEFDGIEYGDCIPFPEKEKTILTVGRLGTEQKATQVLLEAFARIADDIPDWSLRMVGPVDESFIPYRDEFMKRNARLSDRISFAGSVEGISELRNEYEKARVFALPSGIEGGAPNVIAEALHSGCVTVVTRFDAWKDCIDSGRCGMASEIGDIDGFAECLKSLCMNGKLEKMSERAREYAAEYYDMEKNVQQIFDLLTEDRG